MANYVYLENNQIKEYYDFLPLNWRNISGFNHLINDEEYLKSLGWHKVIKTQVNFNPNNYKIVGYNYTIINNNVYEEPIIEEVTPVLQQLSVPNQISATQIRLWLIRNNIPLDNINLIINSIEDEMTKNELLIIWEYAPYIERNNSFVNSLGSLLGLNSDQIDQAFIEASKYLT